MTLPDFLDAAHYVEIRSRRVPGAGRQWVVGVQWRKGGKVVRVTDEDLGRACREAASLAKACSAR